MQGQSTSTGDSIRTLRKLAGLTLEEVAVAADTSIAYLSKVETNKLIPSRTYVGAITATIAARMKEAA